MWNEGICHLGLCVSQFLASSAAQLRSAGSGEGAGAWQGEGMEPACHAHQTLAHQLESATRGSRLSLGYMLFCHLCNCELLLMQSWHGMV